MFFQCTHVTGNPVLLDQLMDDLFQNNCGQLFCVYMVHYLHKFVDNTTLSELITTPNTPSNMTDYLSSLLIWTIDNDMELDMSNSKTKEMLLGWIDSTSILLLSTAAGPIQRITNFKLLGLHLDASLSWTTYINTIISKASKRLYFLKQLKRAGVSPHQLLHFYTAAICPVLEYASPVRHYSITRVQTEQLESIQKSSTYRFQFHPWHVIF